MAIIHVWSGGTPSAPYATWATAAATLAVGMGATSAGDTVWVAHDHSETTAGITGVFTGGTSASPVKVICGTRDTVSGITGLATTASVKSSNTTLSFSGIGYMYGILIEQTSSSNTNINLTNTAASNIFYDNCRFTLNVGSTSTINCGFGSTSLMGPTYLKDCSYKFGAAGQVLNCDGNVYISGGSIVSGSTSTTTFARMGGGARGGSVTIYGFDFTNYGTGFNVFSQSGSTIGVSRARNCKMPASWAGAASGTLSVHGVRCEVLNYTIGTGDTNYKFLVTDTRGTSSESVSIYRNSGASDETTPHSIKMVSLTALSWPCFAMVSPQIIRRVAANPGSSNTATIHFTVDAATALTDSEIWMELEYLGDSGYATGVHGSDATTLLGSAAAQTTSAETWTGTGGFSAAKKQKLSVIFNAEETGYIIATVHLAVASTTVYVDPKIEIS